MLVEAETDIAVDLMGPTKDARSAIFSFRPAPIQVNYLGYPGTMGASYIDYLIADQTVLPVDQQELLVRKRLFICQTAFKPTIESV